MGRDALWSVQILCGRAGGLREQVIPGQMLWSTALMLGVFGRGVCPEAGD